VPLGRQVGLHPSNIVLDGDSAPLPRKGTEPPIFGPCLLWPNGWIDQDASWHGGGLGPSHIALDGAHLPLPQKGGTTPNFRPMSIVAKRLDG